MSSDDRKRRLDAIPPERLSIVAKALCASSSAVSELAAKSDTDIANLLVEHVLADEPIFSTRYEIVDSASERLRNRQVREAEAELELLTFDNATLRAELAERDELLASAIHFQFGDYVALRIVSAPPADAEIWRVRYGCFDIGRTDHTREQAIAKARELAANAFDRRPKE